MEKRRKQKDSYRILPPDLLDERTLACRLCAVSLLVRDDQRLYPRIAVRWLHSRSFGLCLSKRLASWTMVPGCLTFSAAPLPVRHSLRLNCLTSRCLSCGQDSRPASTCTSLQDADLRLQSACGPSLLSFMLGESCVSATLTFLLSPFGCLDVSWQRVDPSTVIRSASSSGRHSAFFGMALS